MNENMTEISDGTWETHMDAVWEALRDHPELKRMRRRCSAHEFRTLFAEFQRLAVAPVEAERDEAIERADRAERMCREGKDAPEFQALIRQRDEARAELERVRQEELGALFSDFREGWYKKDNIPRSTCDDVDVGFERACNAFRYALRARSTEGEG